MLLEIDATGRGVSAPNPGGQVGFCEDWTSRTVALEGGWGAGKTWAGARKLLTLHVLNAFDDQGFPTGVKSAGVAATMPNAKDFMIPELLDACGEFGLEADYKVSDANIYFTGSNSAVCHIKIRSAEHPERIAGWEVGAYWGDEPARWKVNKHNPLLNPILQLKGRLRDPKARFLQGMYTYTNEGDHTEIYNEMNSGKPDHALYRAGTVENPVVEDFYAAHIDSLTTELVDQYLKGKAINFTSGKVYTSFDYTRNTDKHLKLVEGVPLQLAVDFNISPGMHAIVGQYNQAADVFTAVYEIYEPRMNVRQLAAAFAQLVDDLGGWCWPGELQVFGDATGSAEWAGIGASCYEILAQGLTLAKIPFTFLVPEANPLVVDRVNAFNVALSDIGGEVHYKVHPRCVRLINDMLELSRNQQGEIDKAERNLSHASDADGYRVHLLRPARRLDHTMGRVNV